MGRKFGELYSESRRYLGKDDLNGPMLVVIDALRDETVKGDGGDEDKHVLHFKGNVKPLILNKTNAEAIRETYGDDLDDWVNKPIEVYKDPGVMYQGKRTGGVRVRAIPNGNGHSEPFDTMTLDQAVAACGAVGVSKNELVESLKAKGHSGYNAARDTAHVREIVERVNSRNDQPRTDEEQAIHAGSDIEDDIPF